MRTPSQRVTHEIARLSVAAASLARAEMGIRKVTEKKTSAVQYAKNNVVHADRAILLAKAKLLIMRSQLEQAERNFAALAEKARNAVAEVAGSGSRYDRSIECAVAVRDEMRRKHDAIQEEYLEAQYAVEALEKTDLAETLRQNAEMRTTTN